MPTRISDVIVPEVFNPYVIQRTMEQSALVQSGVIVNTPEFNALASAAAYTINMPYWEDLTGADEVLSDVEPLTPGKITTSQDMAVILRRGRAWGTNDLAGSLAGSDPALAIGELVSAYWARRIQAVLLAKLKGVFTAAADMAANIHDVHEAAADAGCFTASTFVDAVQKLGDAKDQLTGILMHSATEASLAKQDLISVLKGSEGKADVKTFMGKSVVVDDSCPKDASDNYTSYIFGRGAIALGNGSPVRFVATETARDSLAGEDFLVNRQTWILHPRGVKWALVPASFAGVSPSNVELAIGANWARVYEPKAIRMVAFIHKLK